MYTLEESRGKITGRREKILATRILLRQSKAPKEEDRRHFGLSIIDCGYLEDNPGCYKIAVTYASL